jgi:glycosyltransferase involved in cell wall biosynthesis
MQAADPIVYEELPGVRRSLRVAVVTETWPPEVNGVATTAARFVEGLRSRGHQIQLVRPRQRSEVLEESQDEVLVRGFAIPKYPSLKMGLPARRALERLWTLRRPDVVHIVTEGPLGWSALQAAEKLRLGAVSDFRTNFHAYSRHYGVGWLKAPILAYLRKFHNRTLFTFVPTEGVRAELAALGVRGLRVIARGVDTKQFDPARRDERLRAGWGAAPSDPVFIHVGRLAAEKNLACLADAYEAALQRSPRAKLVLVGDGPERRALQQRFPDAIFAGTRGGADLAAHFASGDIFLFPSLTETFGNVTLEAMASGLAVVAFGYAAAADAIRHGSSGLLVPFGDADSFARHAAVLAGNLPRARQLGARARLEASGRGWGKVVAQLEAALLIAADAGPVAHKRGQPASFSLRPLSTK